ncbi:MAG: hypothetical protein BWZ11_00914 [Bacteroidetes bacterium ADurb.BinA395]|nr:MAG: hypothetical protein BWZ11_00914 [Bacteroidetes bacterium ADurb.BinA395]
MVLSEMKKIAAIKGVGFVSYYFVLLSKYESENFTHYQS